jgi:hypothetical protein
VHVSLLSSLLHSILSSSSQHGCKVGAIASGQFQLYQPYFPTHKVRVSHSCILIPIVLMMLYRFSMPVLIACFSQRSSLSVAQERLHKKVTELWSTVNKQPLPSGKNYIELVVLAEESDDSDIEVCFCPHQRKQPSHCALDCTLL